MEEYGKRYFDASVQLCELVKEKNNGVFPVDLMSLPEDVVSCVILEACIQKNNFDLLCLIFLKFSRFEFFDNYKSFVESVFRNNNANDNCFFLFCLLRHMNSIFYEELNRIESPDNCFLLDEDEFYSVISNRNRRSLQTIFNDQYIPILNNSMQFIKSMDKKDKLEIIRYFRCLIFEYGFNCVLYFFNLNELDFFFFCLDVDCQYDKMVKTKITRRATPSDDLKSCQKKKGKKG